MTVEQPRKLVGLVGMLDSIEGLAQITKTIGRAAGKDYEREDLIKMLANEGYTSEEDINKFFEVYNKA